MSDYQCLFCGHANPAEAKICNDCSEPLLKPCKQCDAINDMPARSCDRCGAAFPAQPSSIYGLSNAIPGVLERPSTHEFPGAREHDIEVLEREPRRLIGGVTPFMSDHRAAQLIPVPYLTAITQRSRVARLAMPALLAVAVGLWGYSLYRGPVSKPTDSSSVIGTPSSVVPATAGNAARAGAGSAAMLGTTALPATTAIPTASETAIPPATQGKIRTVESTNIGAQTQTPLQAPVAAVSQSIETRGDAARPSMPAATEPQQHAVQPAGQRGMSKPGSSNRTTIPYPGTVAGILMGPRAPDSSTRVAADASLAKSCTEGVAALGLCNGDTKAEQSR